MTVTVANHDQLRQQRVQKIEVKRIRSHPKRTKLDQTIQSSSNRNFKRGVKSATKRRSPSSSSHLQHRSTIATATATHPRPTTANSSSPNSPSTSPMNLSRSTSPAASIANFIRPISPPYIHVKEPLSPKFARASSTTATNFSSVQQCTPTTTTTEPVSSSVVESCFEPETYRNLSPLNSNQQKKLSFSDPTLNQTTKVSRQLPQSPVEPEEHLSISSLQQRLTPDDDDDDDAAHSDDETENPSSDDEPLPKEKASTLIRQSRKVIPFLSDPETIHKGLALSSSTTPVLAIA